MEIFLPFWSQSGAALLHQPWDAAAFQCRDEDRVQELGND